MSGTLGPAPAGSPGHARTTSRERLVRLLESQGPLSRAELIRRSGLSRSTVSTLVQQLIAEDLLVEHEVRGTPLHGRSGRPPVLLELTSPAGVVVGVDLGHRHVRVAVARPDGGLLADRTSELDVDESPEEALDHVASELDDLLSASGHTREDVRAVGMGIPGPVDRDGRMTSGILPRWRGSRPAVDFERRTGLLAKVDNDAHMGARGELVYGAARGRRDVVYVKAATGIGCGIVVDGHLVGGASGIAGELGHVQVDEAGVICRCGSRGCLETEVSAPKVLDLLQPAHDETLTVPRMLALAAAGDAGVNRALGDAGRRIGRVLADMCNLLNPEVIVSGGSIGSAPALLAGIRESVDRYAQPTSAGDVEVVPGELGEDAEVMGAIAVALSIGSPLPPR